MNAQPGNRAPSEGLVTLNCPVIRLVSVDFLRSFRRIDREISDPSGLSFLLEKTAETLFFPEGKLYEARATKGISCNEIVSI